MDPDPDPDPDPGGPKTCGSGSGSESPTLVAIKVNYLCRIECGDLRGVTTFVVAVVAGDDILPLHHLLHDHLVDAPAHHHNHPVILPLIFFPNMIYNNLMLCSL